MNNRERLLTLNQIDEKLQLFEECLNEIKILKTYNYVEYIEGVIFKDNSTLSIQKRLIAECTLRKLTNINNNYEAFKENKINTINTNNNNLEKFM